MRKTLSQFHIMRPLLTIVFYMGALDCCAEPSSPVPTYVQLTIIDVTRREDGKIETMFQFTEFGGPTFTTTYFPAYQVESVQMIRTSQDAYIVEAGSRRRYSIHSRYKKVRTWWNLSHINESTNSPPHKAEPSRVTAPIDTVKSLLYW